VTDLWFKPARKFPLNQEVSYEDKASFLLKPFLIWLLLPLSLLRLLLSKFLTNLE
jgi:hypothetical protein